MGIKCHGTGSKGYKADILLNEDKIERIGTTGIIEGADGTEVLPKIRQGITTEILGQDGISMAPLPKRYISPWRKNLAGLDGDSDEIDWNYETTENYLKMIEHVKPGLNECYLVPHGNIRMEAGAIGLSTGLIYMPCAYSESKEIIEMCKVVAESGVKIHYSHFKVCGKKNWNKVDKVIELLEKAKAEGIHVSFDQYPYVAGSTMLGVILPPWVHDGGTDRVLERLANSELRKKMVYDIENGIPGWDNFVEFAGLDQIFVTSVKIDKNKDAVGMVDFYGTEEHVIRIMKRPEMNACTDGLLGGKPHPRVFGAFPRILGKYVREDKALTLEEAVYKMTKKPAITFNMTGRGEIKEGYVADICIFNPKTVIDKGTFIEPIQYPEGIEYVIVHGEVAVEKGVPTGKRNGVVLRKKGKEVI